MVRVFDQLDKNRHSHWMPPLDALNDEARGRGEVCSRSALMAATKCTRTKSSELQTHLLNQATLTHVRARNRECVSMKECVRKREVRYESVSV